MVDEDNAVLGERQDRDADRGRAARSRREDRRSGPRSGRGGRRRDRRRSRGVGVGSPGAVDARRGHGRPRPQPARLGRARSRSARPSATRSATTVQIGNDVQVAVDGELELGAGSRTRPSSASGGAPASAAASSSNGKLWRGRGAAGEIGHIGRQARRRPLRLRAARLPRGLRRPRRHGGAARGSRQARARRPTCSSIMEKRERDRAHERRLGRALDRGDKMATELIDRAVAALGAGIGSAVNLLDVEAVIVGGGLGTRLGEPYVERIAEAMHAAPLRRRAPARDARGRAGRPGRRDRRRAPGRARLGVGRRVALERLARGGLLGRLLRGAVARADGLAVDVRGAGEAAVVRRALDLEDGVRDRAGRGGRAPPGAPSCSRRGPRARTRSAPGRPPRSARGSTRTRARGRGRRGTASTQRREDVAVRREPEQLVAVDLARVAGEQLPEAELAADDGAAVPRDDVRADLRQAPLRLVREALVELLGDREAEDAVAEKLEALVRVGPATRPGCVREGVVKALGRKRLDQVEQRAPAGSRYWCDEM